MVPAEGILLRLKAGRRPETDEEHYQGLVSLLGARRPRCVIVDPSAASFQEVIRRHGGVPGDPGKNNVLDGIRQVSHRIKGRLWRSGPVRTVSGNLGCTAGIRRETRTAVKENDHAMDDIRYFVATALWDEQEEFIVFANRRTGGF